VVGLEVAAVVGKGSFRGLEVCGAIWIGFGFTLARFAPDPSGTWPRCVLAGVRGGVGIVDEGGENLGDVGPDLVASLDVWYGLDSFEGALDTGNDIGSNAKLLVRVWCIDEL